MKKNIKKLASSIKVLPLTVNEKILLVRIQPCQPVLLVEVNADVLKWSKRIDL